MSLKALKYLKDFRDSKVSKMTVRQVSVQVTPNTITWGFISSEFIFKRVIKSDW